MLSKTANPTIPALKDADIASKLDKRLKKEVISMVKCIQCGGLVRPKIHECNSCEALICGVCATKIRDSYHLKPPCCSRGKFKPVNRKLRALIFDRLKIVHQADDETEKTVMGYDEYCEYMSSQGIKGLTCPNASLLTTMQRRKKSYKACTQKFTKHGL